MSDSMGTIGQALGPRPPAPMPQGAPGGGAPQQMNAFMQRVQRVGQEILQLKEMMKKVPGADIQQIEVGHQMMMVAAQHMIEGAAAGMNGKKGAPGGQRAEPPMPKEPPSA